MSKAISSGQSTTAIAAASAAVTSSAMNDATGQSSTAPPLPPRKSSPNVADNSAVNRMLKPQTNVTGASSLVNLSNNPNLSALISKSSENITTCELEVPKTNAPPVPKHNVPVKPNDTDVDDSLKHMSLTTNLDDPCDKVIVGPAETISGIIDTRPLETRKPIGTNMNLTSSSSSSAIDNKEQKLVASNCANNLYHLKVNMQQQNQIRHQSYPNHMQSSQSASNQQQPSKSQTTPHLGNLEYVKLCTTSSSSSSTSSLASIQPNRAHPTNNSNNARNVCFPTFHLLSNRFIKFAFSFLFFSFRDWMSVCHHSTKTSRMCHMRI